MILWSDKFGERTSADNGEGVVLHDGDKRSREGRVEAPGQKGHSCSAHGKVHEHDHASYLSVGVVVGGVERATFGQEGNQSRVETYECTSEFLPRRTVGVERCAVSNGAVTGGEAETFLFSSSERT
eukprot:scaffold31741_cov66-Phaeocystis_antarctica.AAC.5